MILPLAGQTKIPLAGLLVATDFFVEVVVLRAGDFTVVDFVWVLAAVVVLRVERGVELLLVVAVDGTDSFLVAPGIKIL